MQVAPSLVLEHGPNTGSSAISTVGGFGGNFSQTDIDMGVFDVSCLCHEDHPNKAQMLGSNASYVGQDNN